MAENTARAASEPNIRPPYLATPAMAYYTSRPGCLRPPFVVPCTSVQRLGKTSKPLA